MLPRIFLFFCVVLFVSLFFSLKKKEFHRLRACVGRSFIKIYMNIMMKTFRFSLFDCVVYVCQTVQSFYYIPFDFIIRHLKKEKKKKNWKRNRPIMLLLATIGTAAAFVRATTSFPLTHSFICRGCSLLMNYYYRDIRFGCCY